MKIALPIVLAGCLAIGSQAVHAESRSLSTLSHHVLPVLVQVDSHGKVTDVSPAVELTPHYERLLRATLDEMITKPAFDHGKPVASQFVIKLGLKTTPRDDGKYDASFFYVAAQPVPAGQWFWRNEDGRRLALVSDGLRGRFYPRWSESEQHIQQMSVAKPGNSPQMLPASRSNPLPALTASSTPAKSAGRP